MRDLTDRELAHMLRGLIARGVVSVTRDGAETQTADVALWEGVAHKDVEVLQPFGVASRPPANGLALVLAVGGDQGDLVMFPISAPGERMGDLAEGEAALYALDGTRVHVRADGTILITASTRVEVEVKGCTVTVEEGFVRGRHASGSRFAAGPGWSKIAAGGHFVAAGAGGVTVSVEPVVGSEPGAGI